MVLEIVKTLFDTGADIHSNGECYHVSLYLAAPERHTTIAKFQIAMGAQVKHALYG